MAVDLSGADLKRFLAEQPEQPIVMLNLLRFARDGSEMYADYLRHFRPFAEQVGGQIIYYGRGESPLVAEAGQDWDAVLLVRYPSRAAFSSMIRDPDYQRGTHLRTRSLVEAVLQPTVDMTTTI
jgi:uncharacterized protein (DUF1330 family)